jgi:Arc/MetJ-type ribon-helix-helix transcriptional regulator
MMFRNTENKPMSAAKIAITIDQELLTRLDRLVKERRFPNRSRAVQEALQDKLERLDRSRLARECAKLDPHFEQQLADEGLAQDAEQWPEY